MQPGAAQPHLLIVEDDAELQYILQSLLIDEGYAVVAASSLPQALALLGEQVFQLIITDLFAQTGKESLDSVEPLCQRAAPTPVAVLTGWRVSEEDIQQRGFACLIKKPFELDELLASIAVCLQTQLSPEQERQAKLLRAYFQATEQRDVERVLHLCAEDIIYHPPEAAPFAQAPRYVGKSAYRTYLEGAYRYYRVDRIEKLAIYPRPKGLAVRYAWQWTAPDGSVQQTSASMLFAFEGDAICQIRFEASNEKVRELLEKHAKKNGEGGQQAS